MDSLLMRRRAMMLESSDKSVLYEAYNLVFTGSNYIDTGIKLFSEENIGRDFELYADLVTGAGDTFEANKLRMIHARARTSRTLSSLQ